MMCDWACNAEYDSGSEGQCNVGEQCAVGDVRTQAGMGMV